MQHKIDPQQHSEKLKDNITLQAVSMAFGTMASRVLGLLRDQAFAAMFDRTVTDAWTVAFRLPNMFRRLLGEGSLSVSFIPVFVEARTLDESGVRAKNLVNSFYSVLLIVLSCLTAVGIIFAPQIIRLITAPAYSFVPGKFALTVHMAQVMFCFIFFMSTYAFFMAILNSLGRYALAAAAPTLFNVAMIIANFVPSEWQFVKGEALAWGVVVGGLLQTAILIPSLIKFGYLPKLRGSLSNSDANRVWRNMLPGMLGMGMLQITTVINTQFASSLGEGILTHLYLADRLLELPLSLISVSLGTALLPALSKYWARKDKATMVATANYYFRLNLFTAVPAAIGLYFLAEPIVQLLYMRHKFSLQDAIATANIVKIYGFTLIASSSIRVLVPAFYAVKNTWLPAVVSGICLVAHVLIAPVLMSRHGVSGLVVSTLFSACLNLLMLLLSHRWLIGSFGMRRVARSLLKMLIPATGLALTTLFYLPLLRLLGQDGWARLIALGLVICGGAAIYAALAYYLKIEEFKGIVDRLCKKIAAKAASRK